jgi:serine/threonine protein kinase
VTHDPERWRRIQDLCHAALERDAPERDGFLAAACEGDDDLRRDVESFLVHAGRADEFLGASTMQAVAFAMVGKPRASLIGRQIGAYRVVEFIGAGGMGEVYRARDTKLHRDVALKVLPELFVRDQERLGRFQREAHVLASLNHPHIAAIYGLEESEHVQALVLELVEGPTLADRIAQGPIPLDEACAIADQIAGALEEAHRRGFAHRDLKPANVKLRPDGTVKVLDFGLAKATEDDDSVQSHAPTPAVGPTRDGVILGTTRYMAPEQARGRAVDKRADIWAFGCVLWEMLTGEPAFVGETVSDTISAILTREPAWKSVPVGTPAGIRRVLRRCLEKDLVRRLHDIADARLEIHDTVAGVADVTDAPALQPAIADVEFQRLTDFVGMKESPAVSPDGRMVAFVSLHNGRRQIWIRLLAGGVPLQVTRDDNDHNEPRWAPDASTLLYHSPSAGPAEQGALWEIAALGGPSRRVTAALSGGDVSHDGRRIALFQSSTEHIELVTMARDGSQRVCVARGSPGSIYRSPRWSPDDRFLAFQRESLAFATYLEIVPAAGGEPREVARSAWLKGFSWLPDGSGLVYSSSRGSTLLYPPIFNLRTVDHHGRDDRQLTYGDQSFIEPDVHQSGRLLAGRIRAQSDIWKFAVGGSPADNTQRRTRVTRQTGQAQTPSVSPNGAEVAYLSDNGGHGNLWIATMDGSSVRQLTFERDPAVNVGVPMWSPTGDWIAFVVSRDWRSSIWLIRPDGSGLHELVDSGWGPCWTSDGRELIYTTGQDAPAAHLERIALNGGAPVVVRIDASTPAVASDGRTLYYVHGLRPELLGLRGDLQICRSTVGEGPSHEIGRIAASRVPVSARLLQLFLSPDGQWLAVPLVDGATSNVWALPTSVGPMKQVTAFGDRCTVIARSVSWSADSQFVFAAVADTETDIVLFDGLLR